MTSPVKSWIAAGLWGLLAVAKSAADYGACGERSGIRTEGARRRSP